MIEQAAEQCVGMIYFAFLASWHALPVFVVVAVLSFLIRKRVPARYVCWLWLIVIARLLLPVSVESEVAISSVVDKPAQMLISGDEEIALDSGGFDTFTYEDYQGKSVTAALLPADATAEEQAEADAYVANITAEKTASLASLESGTEFNQVENSEILIDTLEPLLIVLSYSFVFGLPAVAIAMLLRGVGSHLQFAWRLWFIPAIIDRDTVDCLLRVCDDLGVGRRPKLKEVPSLHSPAVFGLLRPIVCLPSGWRERLTPEQLDWVFRHEVAHVKSRDGLLLFVASISKSLHWFNPLSWIAVAKLQQHMERAADEMATRHLNESKIREYGELLLEFAAGQTTSRGRATVGLLAMAAPHGLQGRIESLTSHRPKRRWVRRMTLVPAIAIIAASGLTDAKTIELPPAVPPHQVPSFDVNFSNSDWQRSNSLRPIPPENERRTVSINVVDALCKARDLQPGVDAEKFLMVYFVPYQMTAKQREKTTIVDGAMTVNVTEQQEALVKQRLTAFEQSGLWQVETELRIMEIDVRLLNQFDWLPSDSTTRCRRLSRGAMLEGSQKWDPTLWIDAASWPPRETTSWGGDHSASVPVRAIKISRLQSGRLIHQTQQDVRSNVMQAPKVTLFNGQSGMISDVVQRPFVTDVLAKSGDLATTPQPRISIFEDGWRILMKTTVTKEEKVNLQLVLTHSSIDSVKLASLPPLRGSMPDEEVTIQVPQVRSDSIAVASILGADDTLLVFSPKPYSSPDGNEVSTSDRGMGQVFMVRTRLIPDDDFLNAFIPIESR